MTKPTLQQVKDYIRLNGFHDVNPEKFWHYYESIGWTVGKACKPMKQWKSAIVTWTKTTEASRKAYMKVKCKCGCGRRPRKMIDGLAYYNEFCMDKMQKKLQQPLNVVDTRGMFKKMPEKPKLQTYKILESDN